MRQYAHVRPLPQSLKPPESPERSESPGRDDDIADDIVAQDVALKQTHYTISRDEILLGGAKEDKFQVLRTEADNKQYQKEIQPYTSLQPHHLSRAQRMQMGLPSQAFHFYNDNPMKTRPAQYGTSDASNHGVYGFQPNTLGSAPSQPDALISFLKEELETLQMENEKLQKLQKLQREDKPVVNFEVLHYISSEAGTETCYLGRPYWATSSEGPQLKAKSSILYPDAYIQYKSPAFIVERYYSGVEDIPAESIDARQQNQIPSPIPTSEMIRFVSNDMKEAIKALVKNNEDLKKKDSQLFTGEQMQAPYLWWWCYRGKPNICDNMSLPQKELIKNLTNWIDDNYSELYSRIDSQFELGMVSEKSLRFLIQPGDVLIRMNGDSPEAHLAISSLNIVDKEKSSFNLSDDFLNSFNGASRLHAALSPTKKDQQQEWEVDVWSYGYNGNFFRVKRKLITRFSADIENAEIPIRNLGVYPLRFASHELRGSLEQRGKIFWSCRHKKYISYAKETKEDSAAGQRYMIDYPTDRALHPESEDKWGFEPETKVDTMFIEQETPSEPDIYLLPRTILGFNLRRKQWEDLNVDLIKEISWNKDAFKHLVADPETKELVQTLVTNKIAAERGTDLIQNKGNGLIMLLHGGPGTGKTFTAESVAEMAEKPLYAVTCGDIGTEPEKTEKYLESVFHLGKMWGCVVLLDEAEVFLEQRSLNDLARNALVSVFLRALEYYDGILILTSNRVGTFDEAFKSRIQLALHYKPLTQPQRARIWLNFFSHLKSLEENTIDYDDIESYIDELSEHEMNGRQIRNVITTARQWAQFRDSRMKAIHLMDTIKVTGKFDTYIKDVKEGYSDDQIARGDGVR